MRKKKYRGLLIVYALFSAFMILACIGIPGYFWVRGNFNRHSAVITVTEKERVNQSDDSYYLVFGKDESGKTVVYKNADDLFRMKFNSSDVQAQLEIGNTYEVQLVGLRVPFFSMYENILSAKEIDNG